MNANDHKAPWTLQRRVSFSFLLSSPILRPNPSRIINKCNDA